MATGRDGLPRNQPYCRQCGKLIVSYVEGWAYRRLMRMAGRPRTEWCTFCSWSCLCKAQHAAEAVYGIPEDPYEKARRNTEARWRRRYAKIKAAREAAKEKAQEGV